MPLHQITNKKEHDDAVSQSLHTPTVIYVSNSNVPVCKSFTPRIEDMAERYSSIRFYQMELQSETSMLFKFSPNQLPVTVLMVGDRWCRTVMGDDLRELEGALGELGREAEK